MTPNDVEYQVGAHDADASGVDLGTESEFLPWDIEFETVFKRLADDIYSSTEAGIREPTTNSATTILDAISEGLLDPADGQLLFQVRTGNETELLISDNGMGMSEAKVREVLRVLGRSTMRDRGDLSGMFGMGFVAVFKLIGLDAGFELYTHSRKDGEGPVSAIINNRGITLDHEGVLPDSMGAGEYGTKLKFLLKDSISPSDVRGWVKKNTEYARINVTYQELSVGGEVSYEASYGQKEFEADYNDGAPIIVVENDAIRAVMSPEADSRTVLLDVPVRRNHYGISGVPWSVDVRLKNENGLIVDGPHAGLMSTSNGDYDSMAPDRQSNYAPIRDITRDDIVMPTPSGTRDTLVSAKQFWNKYVSGLLTEAYENRLQRTFAELSTPDDVLSLDRDDLVVVMDAVETLVEDSNKSADSYHVDDLIEDAKATYGLSLDFKIAQALRAFQTEVTRIDPEYGVDGTPSYREKDASIYGELPAWEVAVETTGRVFMGVSLNQMKADVVWEDHSENCVVQVESAEQYEAFADCLGWEQLRSITSSTIDEFDVSDDLRERFTSSVGSKKATSVEAERVTLHFNKSGYRSSKRTVQARDIKSEFDRYSENDYRPNFGRNSPLRIILFSDADEANVSDHYYLGSGDMGIARCSAAVADYLTEHENITTYSDYVEQAAAVTVKTNLGQWNVSVSTENIVFHVLSESMLDLFRQDDVLEHAPSYLCENIHAFRNQDPESLIYAPVSIDELLDIQLLLYENDATILTGDESYTGLGSTKSLGTDLHLYAHARLESHLSDSDESEAIRTFFNQSDTDLSDGGQTVVDLLAAHLDSR